MNLKKQATAGTFLDFCFTFTTHLIIPEKRYAEKNEAGSYTLKTYHRI